MTLARLTLLAIVTTASAIARADTLWISSSGATGAAKPLELPNVKVVGVSNGKIAFSSGGRESTRDLSQVARIQLDDEPALNAAEQAAGANQLDAAVDGYQKTLNATAKDWLKIYAAKKLAEIAPKANRFDAAVAGYIAFALADPQHASALKPALPDAKSSYLATAINDLNAALARPNLNDAQRQVLQSFLLELQRARGDQKGAAQTAQQLLQSGASGPESAAAAASLAKVRLDGVSAQLANKQFAKAIEDVTAIKSLLTDPKDQATALFFLAEAKAGLAAQQPKPEAAALQDAALAYMRVVAHFKDASPPAATYVPKALIKTAQLEEQLNDPNAARSLYEQIVAQYPQDQTAAGAKLALQRLGNNK